MLPFDSMCAYSQLMMKREEEARAQYSCGRWLDTEEMVVIVTKVNTTSGSPDTRVDLGALTEQKWEFVCEKICLLHAEGLCVHVLAALQKKNKQWKHFMKPWETIAGARRS